MGSHEELPDWERLLAAERHIQHLIPGATLVGGTAAAIHAHHRVSMDGDHVLDDLRERFDEVLTTLEAVSGGQTARVQRPVIILGQLDGILTGIRQLRRTVPPDTELVAGLRVPTLSVMARIRAWLLITRDTLRDYLEQSFFLNDWESKECRARCVLLMRSTGSPMEHRRSQNSANGSRRQRLKTSRRSI